MDSPRISRREIGPVAVEVSSREEAIDRILACVERGSQKVFGFCNAHTVNLAFALPEFADALRAMTLFNDGVGVSIASRVLHAQPFVENLNGTDLIPDLLCRLPPGTRIFLLGTRRDVLSAACEALSASFPQLEICGSHDGFFSPGQGKAIAAETGDLQAQLVLVGMGQPRQELWAVHHGISSGATLLCVGAYLDFAAGRFARAPALIRRMRLEWLFRLVLEPKRLWRRYLIGNAAFLCHVARLRLGSGRWRARA
jgi:exopolysaccharide biosynthesis WecB/TagA/CpsF family protein